MEIGAGKFSGASSVDADYDMVRGSSAHVKKKARSRANSDDEVRFPFIPFPRAAPQSYFRRCLCDVHAC